LKLPWFWKKPKPEPHPATTPVKEKQIEDAVTKVDKLRGKIVKGEILPWKGLWFTVAAVNHDSLVLKVK